MKSRPGIKLILNAVLLPTFELLSLCEIFLHLHQKLRDDYSQKQAVLLSPLH